MVLSTELDIGLSQEIPDVERLEGLKKVLEQSGFQTPQKPNWFERLTSKLLSNGPLLITANQGHLYLKNTDIKVQNEPQPIVATISLEDGKLTWTPELMKFKDSTLKLLAKHALNPDLTKLFIQSESDPRDIEHPSNPNVPADPVVDKEADAFRRFIRGIGTW